MSGESHVEDAEIRVGVLVRPLRGHWRPAKLPRPPRFDANDTDGSFTLDPSVWKTATHAFDEANMQFTSKMVYSNQIIKETVPSFDAPKRTTQEVDALQRRGKATINVDALVKPCPNTCSCHTSSLVRSEASKCFEHRKHPRLQANKFDSPPLKRIELPADLASAEKVESLVKQPEAEQEMMKTAKYTELAIRKVEPIQMAPKHEEKAKSGSESTSSASSKSAPIPAPAKRPDSKEETRITLKPVTGQTDSKHETSTGGSSLSNYSNRPSSGSKEKHAHSSQEDLKMKSFPLGLAHDRGGSARDSDRMRVKFDIQDGYKSSYLSAPCFSGDICSTLANERKERTAPKIRETAESSSEKNKPKRTGLTMAHKSRLKTVTYKEEPFMSEFKSWLLLLVFIFVVLFYRTTLSPS